MSTNGFDTQKTIGSRPVIDNIPQELKVSPFWVPWKFEYNGKPKPDKVPYYLPDIRGSSTDSSKWWTFDECLNIYNNNGFDGIGFVFDYRNDLTGVDLDNCINEDGDISPTALEFIKGLNTYAEKSPSGRGIKAYCIGRLPPKGSHKFTEIEFFPGHPDGNIEFYDTGRFFAVTGDIIDFVSGRVERRQEELDSIVAHCNAYYRRPVKSTGGTGKETAFSTTEKISKNSRHDTLLSTAKSMAKCELP